ncbi:hypothetical protein JYQ79_05365, partial [Anaerobutyricum hallii]|uniref:hypothetical protein n=1 Tax=Anaerobutyricum hallii TaxID=39488 RepID=UPI001ADD6326
CIFSSGEILSIKNAPFQINSFIFLTVYLKGSIPLTPIFVTLVTDIGVILSGVRLSASPRQIPI